MVAYCASNGTGFLNDRRQIDMTELNYYDSILGESPHYLFTRSDGINGQMVIYVCPITNYGNVNGYLLSYMEPAEMSDFFENSVYGDKAFFLSGQSQWYYYGKLWVRQIRPLFLKRFLESLKGIAESLGSWTLFDRQQQKGDNGILHVNENGVGKILCHFPIADNRLESGGRH